MIISIDFLHNTRRALLERRVAGDHWEGHLSSSALATATAVTAFAAARSAGAGEDPDDERVRHGIAWLAAHGSVDGGWGDTTDSVSNISTTALVWAALAYGREPDVERAAASAERWIVANAGSARPDRLAAALADRYGKDRTFSVPILTMCAIAGRLGAGGDAWRLIPQLPFELAVLPQRFYGALRLPVVSYALPALISMGLARHRRGPAAPGLAIVRERAAARVLRVLEGLQPRGGGFLEAVPLTSFVAMSLVAAGESGHPVVREGLEFLRRSQRPDGSWAIDSNLATWVTTLSINALAAGDGVPPMSDEERRRSVRWLLGQQWRARHPYTGAAPGGWAWTDLPGGVPDADDTAGALVALAHLDRDDRDVREAAALAVRWLLDLQNRDGGIPTFCRGWGTLPFDRSASDLTAHALRAWAAWRQALAPDVQSRIDRAAARAMRFLSRSQRADGSFVPLWFGNQGDSSEENPVFGTSRVLEGLHAVTRSGPAERLRLRAMQFLVRAQNSDGGWGAAAGVRSSIEETAVAIGALAHGDRDPDVEQTLCRGVAWLAAATSEGRQFPTSPIGLYFARLWYSEDLYPVIFTASAVEAVAARRRSAGPGGPAATNSALIS